jgi:hypothetical protein
MLLSNYPYYCTLFIYIIYVFWLDIILRNSVVVKLKLMANNIRVF